MPGRNCSPSTRQPDLHPSKDGTGQVSIYGRNYYVGVLHRRREVYVQFDPQRREWLFNDSDGQHLRSQPAVGMDAATIRSLQLPGPKRKRR
jgi:hypothetical protein